MAMFGCRELIHILEIATTINLMGNAIYFCQIVLATRSNCLKVPRHEGAAGIHTLPFLLQQPRFEWGCSRMHPILRSLTIALWSRPLNSTVLKLFTINTFILKRTSTITPSCCVFQQKQNTQQHKNTTLGVVSTTLY